MRKRFYRFQGFARYSTDGKWHVPHFEKMLYDNALLAEVYVRAFQVTGHARHAEVAPACQAGQHMELGRNAWLMMASCLQDDVRSAAKRMQERFEGSHNSHQSNIVSAHLLDCVASESSFFSHCIWSRIVKGHVCASPLSPDPDKAFSLIDTVLVNPSFSIHSSHGTPVLPSGAFSAFSECEGRCTLLLCAHCPLGERAGHIWRHPVTSQHSNISHRLDQCYVCHKLVDIREL